MMREGERERGREREGGREGGRECQPAQTLHKSTTSTCVCQEPTNVTGINKQHMKGYESPSLPRAQSLYLVHGDSGEYMYICMARGQSPSYSPRLSLYSYIPTLELQVHTHMHARTHPHLRTHTQCSSTTTYFEQLR